MSLCGQSSRSHEGLFREFLDDSLLSPIIDIYEFAQDLRSTSVRILDPSAVISVLEDGKTLSCVILWNVAYFFSAPTSDLYLLLLQTASLDLLEPNNEKTVFRGSVRNFSVLPWPYFQNKDIWFTPSTVHRPMISAPIYVGRNTSNAIKN